MSAIPYQGGRHDRSWTFISGKKNNRIAYSGNITFVLFSPERQYTIIVLVFNVFSPNVEMVVNCLHPACVRKNTFL